MTEVGIRELRQNLGVHLRRVKAGERLTATERNRPVAQLVPLGGGRLSQLIAEGAVLPAAQPRRAVPFDPMPMDERDPCAASPR